MAIKRYVADADTTITNAFKGDLRTRATASNMGRADSLEVFSIYGQESSGSSELSRILVNFSTSDIALDRTNGVIPSSGSVKFYLRMFNAATPFTVPRNFTLVAAAVSGTAPGFNNFSWQEGHGIDMDSYNDVTRNGEGTNWINVGSSSTNTVVQWQNAGGDYHLDSSSSFKQTFDIGVEDLELDITSLMEQWMTAESAGGAAESKKNYGIGIFLTASQEAYIASADATANVPENPGGAKRSYYTKKFFARSSEFFYRRPIVEARPSKITEQIFIIVVLWPLQTKT